MRAGIITLVLLCLPAAAATASDNVRADNPHITFEGRTVRKSGNVTFDWSNTTVRINFTGTTLDMECSTTGDSYFNVWVDSRPGAKEQKVVHTHGDCRIVLAEGLESGFHSVILQKRSEGEHGCVTIKTFSTDGRIETSSSPFKHHIEFIGDSYTCGYGTESSDRNQPFRTEEENCNLAYASIIGRYFDAGVRTISHSGRGVVRNYDDANPGETMVKKYTQALDGDGDSRWTAGSDGFTPDIVVIYLGTNDFSVSKQPSIESWCTEYCRLIAQIRSNYGAGVPVLCVASKASPLMGRYVEEAVKVCGDENVHWTDIQPAAHDDLGDLGASWHPNYKGQRKVACCIIPYISTLTGWEMPMKAIE